MTKALYGGAFLLGAAVIVWIAADFAGSDLLALLVTLIIGMVYVIGGVEQWRFRQVTNSLNNALAAVSAPVDDLSAWLKRVDPSLQNSVRLRIEGERLPLPGPVLTPYLVGLLVMLGLLGTFMGMVVTLKGAVLALEGTTELQAIRAGLARPIEGLGLAFGTSVAGVAASAMLGLISTLNRRDRMLATRLLDSKAATVFQRFSMDYQRQEAFRAMQAQADALPEVATHLSAMAQRIESMGEALSETLKSNQQDFQRSVSENYLSLANSVEKTLKESLASSSKEASEQVAPVIQAALSGLSEQAAKTQKLLVESVNDRISSVVGSLEATNAAVADAWQSGIQSQQEGQEAFVAQLAARLERYETDLESRASALWERFDNRFREWLDTSGDQNAQQFARWSEWQQGWQAQLEQHGLQVSKALAEQWRQSAEQASETQQKIIDAIAGASEEMARAAGDQSERSLEKIHAVMSSTEDMLAARQEVEQRFHETLNERAESLTASIASQLEQLRDAESARGEAAVERLARLEQTVTEHLATLGQAIEAPMLRLIETASEAPKAAAEVIEQLRNEISRNVEKDNAALEERVRIMEDLNKLLSALEETTGTQRDAIESLIAHSSTTLDKVSASFTTNPIV